MQFGRLGPAALLPVWHYCQRGRFQGSRSDQGSTESVTLKSKLKDVVGGDFQFSDPWRTAEATVEDMLSHRLRIPTYHNFRFNPKIDRFDLLKRMKYFKTNMEFRVSATYSTTNYIMATAITQLVAGGTTWEQLVREKIFKPLGMTSNFAASVDFDNDDVAFPTVTDNGPTKELSPEFAK
ncbi:gigasin-6-like [Aplysia californica]|uniref:Gigasin-6-like n=1 Tax=Aplysia californica TaxID=6500 RepID=A0ABM1ACT5_APLCA|nr:gigasin-6-like [Aplysia californica]